MKKYIVIVRDYASYHKQPSDEYLRRLDRYFISPEVMLDYENNRDKAIDEFDEKYRAHFSRFLNLHYELIAA